MLAELYDRVLRLNSESDDSAFQEAISEVDAAKARIKEIEGDLQAALKERIEDKGEVTFGTKRYYLGKTTKVKAKGNAAVYEALIEAAGDEDVLLQCLASNAWKHGACRNVLGDRWAEVFEETVDNELKVKVVDTEFVTKKEKSDAE